MIQRENIEPSESILDAFEPSSRSDSGEANSPAASKTDSFRSSQQSKGGNNAYGIC